MPQPMDELRIAGDKATRCAESLRERADADMHAIGRGRLLNQAAAAMAKHARRVGLVDEQHCGMVAGQLSEAGQRRDRAVHREEGVGDDEPAAGGAGGVQQGIESGQVAVGIDAHAGPRQPAAVDDARVVPLVTGNEVIGAGEGGDRGGIGGKAAGKDQGSFHGEQVGDRSLQLFVGHRVAAHQRTGAGTEALGAGAFRGGLREPDVAGIPEVVVGPEVEECAAVEAHLGVLPAVANAGGPFEAGGAKGDDLVVDPGQRVRQRGGDCGREWGVGGGDAAGHDGYCTP
jgi:hypothetical protein